MSRLEGGVGGGVCGSMCLGLRVVLGEVCVVPCV